MHLGQTKRPYDVIPKLLGLTSGRSLINQNQFWLTYLLLFDYRTSFRLTSEDKYDNPNRKGLTS